jgi:hypothetical protein
MPAAPPEVTGRKLSAKHLEVLRNFDSYPDSAVIPDPVVAALTSLCPKTVRQHPNLPPVPVSRCRKGRHAGDVRKVLRGEAAE